MVTKSRDSVLTELRSLLAGLASIETIPTATLASQTYTQEQLLARVQVSIDAETKVQTLAGELRDARIARDAVKQREAEFLSGIRRLVQGWYLGSHVDLHKYGMTPKKPPSKRTGEQRALMTAKNRSTREKRGTLGPKQKKAIHGDVTGVVITPDPQGGVALRRIDARRSCDSLAP